MHLGHAYAALFAWSTARRRKGAFRLRIEDIDRGRCRPAFEEAIIEDLAWLGIDWDGPVFRQSDRMHAYGRAIDDLERLGVIYPCFCTRAEILDEIKRAGAAPHGPDGPHYPGTCRRLSEADRETRLAYGRPHALRLDSQKAMAIAGPLFWEDQSGDRQSVDLASLGDVVLARKDTPTSYHLAATLDDHAQGVTLVTRGEDLRPVTHVHRLLQELLGFIVPRWHHHPLITDSNGERLAKRNRAMTLRSLRQSGKTAAQVRAMVGFT